ncbi:uncharacterized protein ARMOST_22582 [Armillaria ostoyae]|uniref:Uncharacterized protein n=1 Tax=Armillaria ostoyae TaxID=47428 RepID=A0A284SD83_ARMOS|nr:uncharacterized protein ARMOST_22582 [Armillaria ostoyae]
MIRYYENTPRQAVSSETPAWNLWSSRCSSPGYRAPTSDGLEEQLLFVSVTRIDYIRGFQFLLIKEHIPIPEAPQVSSTSAAQQQNLRLQGPFYPRFRNLILVLGTAIDHEKTWDQRGDGDGGGVLGGVRFYE